MATTQAQTVAYARLLVNLATQFAALRQSCRDLQVRKSNNAYDTPLAAMATAPFNADGTMGAKDANPVITNPIIDPSNLATPTFFLPSKTNMANMEGVLDAFLTFLDGTGAPAQLNRNGTIDSING